MKKRKYMLFMACILLGLMAAMGYAFGFINEETDLPVYESTSLYPEFTLPELSNVADVIVRAEVAEVGDTFMKEIPVSLTENPDEAAESLSYPITPITLTVYSSVKGDAPQKLIYYEEGGVAENYIQQPDGYAMESGMEVFLFLNEAGYCWGAQSIFPVIDGNVILNAMALEYVDKECVSVVETQSLNSNIGSRINTQYVSVMPVDDFVSVIRAALQ